MFKTLQRYATAGTALWVTAKLFHDWAFVMSLFTAAGVGLLAWLEWGTKFGYSGLILSALLTATTTVWLINGVRVLLRRGTPSAPKMSFDYAYGLALQGLHLGKDDADDASYIQIGVVWRNAGPAALKYHVDHLRVVIGDRTVEATLNRDGTISRDCNVIFFYPSFSREQIAGLKAKSQGMVEYRVRYGHPEHGFLRVATARLNTTFRLDDKAGVVYLIEQMLDQEIGA